MDSGQKVFPKPAATASHSWRANRSQTENYRKQNHLNKKKINKTKTKITRDFYNDMEAMQQQAVVCNFNLSVMARMLLIPWPFNFHYPLLNVAAFTHRKGIIMHSEQHFYMSSQETWRLEYTTHFQEGLLSMTDHTATIRKAVPRMQTHLFYTNHFLHSLIHSNCLASEVSGQT